MEILTTPNLYGRKEMTRGATFLLFLLGAIPSSNVTAQGHMPPQGTMPPSSNVVELSSWTFRGAVGDGRLWFVEFYVPWCRGCKRMAGQWDDLGAIFNPHPDVVIARFDCMQDEALCEWQGIDRTPTVKLYFKGKAVETYKADFFHTDLMRPFLMRMLDKYLPAKENTPDEAAVNAQTPADATSAEAEEAAAAAASLPASGEDTADAAGTANVGAVSDSSPQAGQQQARDEVVHSTPVQPGVYDKQGTATAGSGQEQQQQQQRGQEGERQPQTPADVAGRTPVQLGVYDKPATDPGYGEEQQQQLQRELEQENQQRSQTPADGISTYTEPAAAVGNEDSDDIFGTGSNLGNGPDEPQAAMPTLQAATATATRGETEGVGTSGGGGGSSVEGAPDVRVVGLMPGSGAEQVMVRRGRQGGPAVESLQRDREEL